MDYIQELPELDTLLLIWQWSLFMIIFLQSMMAKVCEPFSFSSEYYVLLLHHFVISL